MTAKFSDVRPGTRLRVLPSVSGCLAPGEVLVVREGGYQNKLHVNCDGGRHYLIPTSEGVLRDFEIVGLHYEGLLEKYHTILPTSEPGTDLPERDATGAGGRADAPKT